MRRMITQNKIETLQNIDISKNSVSLGPDVEFLLQYSPDWHNIELEDENSNVYPLTGSISGRYNQCIRMSQSILALRYEFIGSIYLGSLSAEGKAALNEKQPTTLYIKHDDGQNGVISPASLIIQNNTYQWDESEEAYVLQGDFQIITLQSVDLHPGPGVFGVSDDF